MRRVQPEEGPDERAAAYVLCAAQLASAFAEQRALRLELRIRTPGDWLLWAIDADGKAKLLGQRERNAACSDLELTLFATARAVVGSIISRLTVPERCWLLNRLSAEEDVSVVAPHLCLLLDLQGNAWGLRIVCALTATSSANIASLGGSLRTQEQRVAA